MNLYATKHSLEKMKERRGINTKKAERRIEQAVLRGKPFTAFSSKERAFLQQEEDSCHALAYDGFCYIINERNLCVTLYPLPEWFSRKKHFVGKKKIRDYKKYVLMNQLFLSDHLFHSINRARKCCRRARAF